MIAEGAIAAGCRFFAGYPITPASGIYKSMIDELPKRGDVAIGAPDEISALAFCVGASQRGFKAMTATSGPGFSLMIETLQYAVMTETPVVIALVQRLGPSTGGATQGGQGDVLLAGNAIGGGYTIPVFSPSTPVEAFALTIHSFNVAESLRSPVILLTDKEVAMTSENIDYSILPQSGTVDRKMFVRSNGESFGNYRFSLPAEIPEFAPIGGEEKVTITGSAHDKSGRLQKNSNETIEVLRHLQEKVISNSEEITLVDIDTAERADTIVFSYGISARTSMEAVSGLRAKGEPVSFCNMQTLFPIPEKEIKEAAKNVKKVVVVEENMMGLYRTQIERLLP
ncbi:MAG: pyruvate flavodoxin/ferredoxin oxidoreductase, partial [Bacteroidetes bacterium]|nr:pyruvate flavodoxin/ferredoxin oxidoreductase [Bacteroidota bacterium]